MAGVPIFPLLVIAVIKRCSCDHPNGYGTNIGNSALQIGELLKPPPPPPLSPIAPVPFHGGRGQRQNLDIRYHYQPPPPPHPPPIPPTTDFQFPAPFYKQYNFNFVPSPQPFSTTPSPSLFQKVSGWLFPSQQTSYDTGTVYSSNNIAPAKKDCNPCNLVPWLPVIRYNPGAKNIHANPISTYGPPSPTAFADSQNIMQYRPHSFQLPNNDNKFPQLSPGLPHAVYGPPGQTFSNNYFGASSTYGPPSPTHTAEVVPHNIPSTNPSKSQLVPSLSYGLPSDFHPSSPVFQTGTGQPSSSYLPGLSKETYSNSFSPVTTTFKPPTSSFAIPTSSSITSGTLNNNNHYGSVTPHYGPGILNNELPTQSDVEVLENVTPSHHLELPRVTEPTGFKNSYGETITNTNIFDIPYPISASAAESTKIKTEVLPQNISKPDVPLALANPAPFTLNRGRNIHTLQPVALPNLSVSPLPPIFNARPFRPIMPQFPIKVLQGINQMHQTKNNVNVEQSVPLVEFTQSVEYPTTYIQSPIIEVEAPKTSNVTKAFRNIPNSYIVDEVKDISPQASEDHVSATKTISDSSYESTGTDVGNDIYENDAPIHLAPNIPSNHKYSFADLRGVKDEDVDKYRTESNLQHIYSPLLYLKPSAPHKGHGNFVFTVSTPINENEYEIYDDIPTTPPPNFPTLTSAWDESRTDYSDGLPPPSVHENVYQPKIVQIIVPYTTGKKDESNKDWSLTPEDEYQARKVPSNTEYPISTVTENYSTSSTIASEDRTQTSTENYNSDQTNSAVILNDLYDVKEPPFDIIKLQHTIDDWTEQEYSKQYKTPARAKSNEKHAKQIPDDYFTTTLPSNYDADTSSYNLDFYDHEGSSSIQHSVTDESNDTNIKPRKEYNTIERTKNTYNSDKNEPASETQRPYIYTAASSFRKTITTTTTSTTPAPWGRIQTSISPLTMEKVYVVTSKPWREIKNVTNDWYEVEPFESKKTMFSETYESDNLPFKSPRFLNRPSFGFTSGGKIESVRSDSSYAFSRSWFQRINALQALAQNTSAPLIETSQEKVTSEEEDTIATTEGPNKHG